MLALLLLSTFCLAQAKIEIKCQVDDTHKLYVEGNEVSSGNKWSQVYTANVDSATQLALFAENTFGGPSGIMITIDGEPTDPTAWKCKPVANLAAADAGWSDKNFDDSSWAAGAARDGPKKSFDGGPWWWDATNPKPKACICRLFRGDEIQLQVDDKHQLYDNDGELISEGSSWSTVYTAKGVGPFAIYAENAGGPYGIMVNVNGEPVPAENMRCEPVTGSLADFDAAFPEWKNGDFDDAVWGQARTPGSPTATRKLPGTPIILWSSCSCSTKVVCKFDV